MLHGATLTLQGTQSQGASKAKYLKFIAHAISDAIMMPIGFMIVFVYVTLMLGRLNCVQQRSMLALAGLASIGMTVGFTYGICSAIGLFYGPMHNIIPFLLLGIGIDDMFVIMQCYDNLTPAERWLSI